MAHFYGTIIGMGDTKVTKSGSKNNPILTTAARWNGAIEVKMYFDSETGRDKFVVRQKPWHGKGVSEVIAEGFVGESVHDDLGVQEDSNEEEWTEEDEAALKRGYF